jgi:hypothetical protein
MEKLERRDSLALASFFGWKTTDRSGRILPPPTPTGPHSIHAQVKRQAYQGSKSNSAPEHDEPIMFGNSKHVHLPAAVTGKVPG